MSSSLTSTTATIPPDPISPRFTIELEFVLCLSNPQYIQYLAGAYPHLLNSPRTSAAGAVTELENSDAACFARYLKYLYDYWRTPEYSKYLTHPGATLRNLELLQQEQFRRDVIRPDVIAKLFETGNEARAPEHPSTGAGVASVAVPELAVSVIDDPSAMDARAG